MTQGPSKSVDDRDPQDIVELCGLHAVEMDTGPQVRNMADVLPGGRPLPGESPDTTTTCPVTDTARRWLDTYVKTARNAKGVRLAETGVERYLKPRLGQVMIGKVATGA